MTYDYRAARDRIFGLVRNDEGKVKTVLENTTSITERALLLALVEFAPNIEPSLATLAKMLGTDARSIRRLLRSCESKGFVRVTPRSEGGLHVPSHYELLVDPGLTVPTDLESVRTQGPNPTDSGSGGVRTQGPPKQTSKADKKADKESARSRARKPALVAQEDPKTAAEHTALTKLYFEEFETARSIKPPFDGRDGKAVKELLAKCGSDVAAQPVRGALTNSWWKDKVTIRDIAKDPAKFVGLKAFTGNGRSGPPQPNGGSWKAVVES